MHPEAGHSRSPRLAVVALLALASLAGLVAVRPVLTAAVVTRGDDLALATAWIVAVVAAAWLFAAAGVCVVALRLDRPSVARRVACALPPGLRRLVEVAIVGSCVALPALPALPASAAPRPIVLFAQDQPVVRAPAAAPAQAVAAPVERAPAPIARPRAGTESTRIVVCPGDNLWLIARARLVQVSGVRPSDAQIARYWSVVIAANRSTLRSGDPSLIYPGEIVVLPPARAMS